MSGKEEEGDCLPPGMLVTIKGLESEAGKALNGGSGIILGPPSAADSKDARRYPVLLYALDSTAKGGEENDEAKEELLNPPLKRSVKGVNLEEKSNQKCELYKEASQEYGSQAFHSGDYKETLFWLAGSYERWPEDYRTSSTYANLLREFAKQPKEAWAVLRNTVPNMEPDDPFINESRYDMCITCCAARGKPEEALEWALKIDTDTADHKQMKIEALTAVMHYSRANGERIVDLDSGDGPMLEVHRLAAVAILELEPANGTYMRNVAAAHCMLGDNRQGVTLYRRALATGQLQGDMLGRLKIDLALAMMQCPGGLMEHYRVLGIVDGKWGCVHKASIGQYELRSRGHGDGSFDGGIRATIPEGVEMTLFPIPDIDDTDVFENVDLPPREE